MGPSEVAEQAGSSKFTKAESLLPPAAAPPWSLLILTDISGHFTASLIRGAKR